MRHKKHRYTLGVVKSHRLALMANLSAQLLRHGRIETTLAKAKALRPFVERIITLAKKAAESSDKVRKLHYRRLAIARVRDKSVVKYLFEENVHEFSERSGGYARVYKLAPRIGSSREMGIIELISGVNKKKTPPVSSPDKQEEKSSS